MSETKKSGALVAIIAMMFLFAMISFVTNMAAPFGIIWQNLYDGKFDAGMIGNLANFAAYLFMGIPAGIMITKIGYKKTALVALALGFIGIGIQYISSNLDGSAISTFVVYLVGAFVCGLCVCILNTVVNPMLNLLGGGGNRGNQLIQTGGSLNSLAATLTPMLAGAMIGEVTKKTSMTDVVPLLLIALAIFAVSFVIIYFTKIEEPEVEKSNLVEGVKGALGYRHLVLGIIAIFFYVGIEVGIPSELNFYLSDPIAKGGVLGSATVAGVIVGIYWLLMLVGRFTSAFISGKVSSRAQLVTVSSVAILLLVIAIILPKSNTVQVPNALYNPVEKTTELLSNKDVAVPQEKINAFIASKDSTVIADYADEVKETYGKTLTEVTNDLNVPQIPVSVLLIILCGLCTSVMWGVIFNLATEGLGKYTASASGLFMTMVVGGGIMPYLQKTVVAGSVGHINSYWLVVAMLAYILFFAVAGSKPVKK